MGYDHSEPTAISLRSNLLYYDHSNLQKHHSTSDRCIQFVLQFPILR